MCESRRQKKLEAQRQKTLSVIRQQRSLFETMEKRAQVSGGPDSSLTSVSQCFEEADRKAAQATTIDELEDLIDDAESQGQLRAYICPPAEILDQGTLAIDVMVEWGVLGETITKLRESLGRKLADKDTAVARGALRAIFEQSDSSSNFLF